MLMFMSGDAVHYFDLACWQERMVYQGELKEIRDADAHLGVGLWAKADQTGGINVYKIGADEDEPPEFTLQGHTHYVEYLTFHPSGKILASGSADNTIRFWDLLAASEISSHKVHDDFVTSLAFNQNGNLLVSGDYSGCLKVWDFSTG
jgi:WD40 repeat protein